MQRDKTWTPEKSNHEAQTLEKVNLDLEIK